MSLKVRECYWFSTQQQLQNALCCVSLVHMLCSRRVHVHKLNRRKYYTRTSRPQEKITTFFVQDVGAKIKVNVIIQNKQRCSSLEKYYICRNQIFDKLQIHNGLFRSLEAFVYGDTYPLNLNFHIIANNQTRKVYLLLAPRYWLY